MYNLFTKFPIIFYNDNVAVNLLAKVKFNQAALKASAIYYPYTIAEGERPDVIAANYYDDARYSWLIYMANDIIDPVYDWPLTEEELRKFIIKKYGSLEKAAEGIAFWRTNWYEDETMLTLSGYNSLPSYSKKYFNPVLGASGQVVSYARKQDDLTVDTNKIQELYVANTSGFVVGEQVKQVLSGLTTAAHIKEVSNTTLYVHHVIGSFANGGISGVTSNTTSTITGTTTTSQSIPTNEYAYWTYVSYMDYENELNESKRHIRLVDKSYVDQIEKEMSDLL